MESGERGSNPPETVERKIFSGVHLARAELFEGGCADDQTRNRHRKQQQKNRTLTTAVVWILPVGLPSLSLLDATEAAAAEESERAAERTMAHATAIPTTSVDRWTSVNICVHFISPAAAAAAAEGFGSRLGRRREEPSAPKRRKVFPLSSLTGLAMMVRV